VQEEFITTNVQNTCQVTKESISSLQDEKSLTSMQAMWSIVVWFHFYYQFFLQLQFKYYHIALWCTVASSHCCLFSACHGDFWHVP